MALNQDCCLINMMPPFERFHFNFFSIPLYSEKRGLKMPSTLYYMQILIKTQMSKNSVLCAVKGFKRSDSFL